MIGHLIGRDNHLVQPMVGLPGIPKGNIPATVSSLQILQRFGSTVSEITPVYPACLDGIFFHTPLSVSVILLPACADSRR